MKTLKTYTKIGAGILLFALVLSVVYYVRETSKYRKLYLKELTNVKAYQSENDNLKNETAVHIMTIGQLQTSKDSIDIALKEAIKKLKIKPKNTVSVGFITSNMEKKDSIIIKYDTIFQRKVDIDTIVGDKWYKAQIGLHYPARIDLAVSMLSVKHIIVHNKKETVNPPKKFWLWRLFQKKYTIQEVIVDEENPYIEAGSQKFINIIK